MSEERSDDSNVIQFPSKEHWLMATAPVLLPLGDSHMGLLEAAAWIGSRSRRVSDAVHWHLHLRDHGRDFLAGHYISIWGGLREVLQTEHAQPDSYGREPEWAVAHLIAAAAAGDIVGFGRFGDADEYQQMEPRHWIGTRFCFEHLDSIVLKDAPLFVARDLWHRIKFLRADIERKWPARLTNEGAASTSHIGPRRRIEESPGVRQLREFLKYAEANNLFATMSGGQLRDAYNRWCNNRRPRPVRPVGRSRYFELVSKWRGGSWA